MASHRLAHIELHLAVLLFGLAGLFAKLVPAGPITIVVGRTVIAAAVLFIGLKLFSVSLSIRSRRLGLLLMVSGIVLAIHWLTFSMPSSCQQWQSVWWGLPPFQYL